VHGKSVTEQDIDSCADEAEQGYDLDRIRRRGRKPVGDGADPVVPVLLDKTLLAALAERAERDHLSRSAAIREAIRAFVA